MLRALLPLTFLVGCFGSAEKHPGTVDGCMGGDTADPSGAFGVELGECAEDFQLMDQDGMQVSLYDHAGKVILLDLSAMW